MGSGVTSALNGGSFTLAYPLGRASTAARLDIDCDAFRIMYHVPGIEALHALRDSLGVIVKARSCRSAATAAIARSLFPFGTATGRNAHAKSLYNAHAGMRSFMVFPPDTIGVLSGLADARSWCCRGSIRRSGADDTTTTAGDVYHALALDHAA